MEVQIGVRALHMQLEADRRMGIYLCDNGWTPDHGKGVIEIYLNLVGNEGLDWADRNTMRQDLEKAARKIYDERKSA